MIYSNVNLSIETRKMSFGDLKCVVIGEMVEGERNDSI